MENLINDLINKINDKNSHLDPDKAKELEDIILDKIYSVYPFNKFEYVISHLIANGSLSIENYLDMRNEYLARNKYLQVFEITAPRAFGEWAEHHLSDVFQELKHPTKKLDSDYKGQYDLWLDGIKIEIKASRVVDKDSDEPLVYKALSSESSKPFLMNFQQMKPKCCDVFVWIAVWRDKVRYWVLPSYVIQELSKYVDGTRFSPQHRNQENADSEKDIYEGQFFLTNDNIDKFAKYEVTSADIISKIKKCVKPEKA
ncbi:MAG: hypothetical protein K2K72_00755 [Duncaniella sp.]|nr:hypothetical protein [Duncaniella sp.]